MFLYRFFYIIRFCYNICQIIKNIIILAQLYILFFHPGSDDRLHKVVGIL